MDIIIAYLKRYKNNKAVNLDDNGYYNLTDLKNILQVDDETLKMIIELNYLKYNNDGSKIKIKGLDIKRYVYKEKYYMSIEKLRSLLGYNKNYNYERVKEDGFRLTNRFKKRYINLIDLAHKVEELYNEQEVENILNLDIESISVEYRVKYGGRDLKEHIFKGFHKKNIDDMLELKKSSLPITDILSEVYIRHRMLESYISEYETYDFLGVRCIKKEHLEKIVSDIKNRQNNILKKHFIFYDFDILDEILYRQQEYGKVSFNNNEYYSTEDILRFFKINKKVLLLYISKNNSKDKKYIVRDKIKGDKINGVLKEFTSTITLYELVNVFNVNKLKLQRYLKLNSYEKSDLLSHDCIVKLFKSTEDFIEFNDIMDYTQLSKNALEEKLKLYNINTIETEYSGNRQYSKKDIEMMNIQDNSYISLVSIMRLSGVTIKRLRHKAQKQGVLKHTLKNVEVVDVQQLKQIINLDENNKVVNLK